MMNKICTFSFALLFSIATFTQYISPFNANAGSVEVIDDPAIEAYVSDLNVKPELFKITNDGYGSGMIGSSLDENDRYYKEYFSRISNIESADNPFERFCGSSSSGFCVGMSILAILSHNGIITPNDVKNGAKCINEIELDDDVLSNILAYQTKQIAPDFMNYMNWRFAHYTKEEKVDILLETAERAAKKGEYFLVVADSKNLSHAMAGLGIMDGEWEFNGVKYDKFIPCYDCNAMMVDKETNDLYAMGFCADGSIFVNSQTKETYMNLYCNAGYGDGLSFFACDDYDLMNYKGKINPSNSYVTETSNIERIDISSDAGCSLKVKREDGSVYDGIKSSDKVFKSEIGNVYFCDGSRFDVENDSKASELSVNFINVRNAAFSSFTGMVSNIYKTANDFGFDVEEETSYTVKLVFEENCYDFAPHYKYDLSGIATGNFKATQIDKGIILSGSKGVRCNIITSDVSRDEKGLLISADENINEESIFASDSVLISFVDNKPKFFIGDNFDKEVQKGDVNCDGFIDASDASFVLQAYSALSTGGTTYLNKSIADWDGNGMIDASDASFILQKYAELSTSK